MSSGSRFLKRTATAATINDDSDERPTRVHPSRKGPRSYSQRKAAGGGVQSGVPGRFMVYMTDQLIGTPTFGDLVRRRSHTTSCVNVREWMIDGRCCRGTARQDCLDSGRVLMDKPPGTLDLAPQHAQHAIDAEPGVPGAGVGVVHFERAARPSYRQALPNST